MPRRSVRSEHDASGRARSPRRRTARPGHGNPAARLSDRRAHSSLRRSESLFRIGETAMTDPIVGIDLGTTNSEVAAVIDGEVQVIDDAGETILPSYVGLAPDNQLIVGTPARNQYIVYPERTVKSIKRLMGTDE